MILYSGDCVSVAIRPDFSSRMRGGQWFVARRALLMTTAASLPQMDQPCACFVPMLHPAWGPPAMAGGHHGLRGWRRALQRAAVRTTPADRAGMVTRANMPAWRMGHEAA